MKKLKNIANFKNEQEEAKFWDTHDSTEYVGWSQAERAVFPNLKTSTEAISIRLPTTLLAHLKSLANEKDVGYTSLMKLFLSERVDQELDSQQEVRK